MYERCFIVISSFTGKELISILFGNFRVTVDTWSHVISGIYRLKYKKYSEFAEAMFIKE